MSGQNDHVCGCLWVQSNWILGKWQGPGVVRRYVARTDTDNTSLLPRPFPPLVFNRLQYTSHFWSVVVNCKQSKKWRCWRLWARLDKTAAHHFLKVHQLVFSKGLVVFVNTIHICTNKHISNVTSSLVGFWGFHPYMRWFSSRRLRFVIIPFKIMGR